MSAVGGFSPGGQFWAGKFHWVRYYRWFSHYHWVRYYHFLLSADLFGESICECLWPFALGGVFFLSAAFQHEGYCGMWNMDQIVQLIRRELEVAEA